MSQTPGVASASAGNFADLVFANSMRGLVLVFYWTPNAGPCLRLMPRLVELSRAYAGRFLLVLANTDEVGALAREHGVTSVPTVKFYLRGEAVHTIHGAESDATFRAALARFIGGGENQLRQAAAQAHNAGRTDEAIELLARAAVDQPDDLDISLVLAKLLLLAEQPDRALDLLAALPAPARHDARIAPLLAHLELLAAARQGPEDAETRLAANPDDAEARLTLAARALLDDRTEAALDDLMRLALRHTDYRDDIGRRALLALFAMFGSEHPLTRDYRARLARQAS